MPAPPSDLLEAMYLGTVARHVFVYVNSNVGGLYIWDGIGEFTLDGNTYDSARGLMELEGLSETSDLQNNEVTLTLNGVALSDFLVTPDISRNDCHVKLAWIKEDGTVLRFRTEFLGLADIASVPFNDEELKVAIKLRGYLEDWSRPPRAYYTDREQQRRYPGDTGFKFVSALEGTSVSGWARTAETNAGNAVVASAPSGTDAYQFYGLIDSVNTGVLGDATNGVCLSFKLGALALRDTSTYYFEEGTTNKITLPSTAFGSKAHASGVPLYIDSSGFARSNKSGYVSRNGLSTGRLRRQGTISTVGSAGASTIGFSTLFTDLPQSLPHITGSANLPPAANCTGLVYCNRNGLRIGVDGSTIKLVTSISGGTPTFGASYVEETTGAAVAFASGLLRVAGSNCTISTTGLVRTPGGRRVVLSGGSASSFLRVWS